MRVTYLGELGWELHVPSDQALAVYDALLEAGADLGFRHAGLLALNSLRLEKAYRDYGLDIDNARHADRRGHRLHDRVGQAGRVHRQGGARQAARLGHPDGTDGAGAAR